MDKLFWRVSYFCVLLLLSLLPVGAYIDGGVDYMLTMISVEIFAILFALLIIFVSERTF